jgi:glucose/arabinose dehydrogenase
MRTLLAIAAAAALAAACDQQTQTTAPDTTADMTTPGPAAPPAATVTITESDARSRIEAQGYSNVTGLMQNPDGTWSATATRNGETTQVTVSESGVQVATIPAPPTP